MSMLIRNPLRVGPSQWTTADDAGTTTMATSIALMQTLPGFRSALILPWGPIVVWIRRGLQT
jgi:hypothetical protein